MATSTKKDPKESQDDFTGTTTISFRIQTILYKRWMQDAKSKGQGIKEYILYQLDTESDAMKILDQITIEMSNDTARIKQEVKKLRQELKQLKKEKEAAEKKEPNQ